MKRISYFIRTGSLFIGALLFAGIGICSCDKLDENGKLDGNWQLLEWKVKATNEVVATNTSSKIFYTIKLDLIKMQNMESDKLPYYHSTFHYTKDSLFIDRVYQRPLDNEVPCDSLVTFGGTPSGKYAIETLTNSKMVLSNELNTLSFRKY